MNRLGRQSSFQLNREKIRALFAENFERFGELGASVSVWQGDRETLSLADGFQDRQKTQPWKTDTHVLIWSATKGLAAGTVAGVLESEKIPLSYPVAKIWPEFAAAGKSEITLEQLLSHRGGLSGLQDSSISILDHEAVCVALAAQTPLWPDREQHGYHTRSFGFLLDEIVRRLTSRTLGEMWRTLFGEPLNLDLWIGLPGALRKNVSSIFPAKLSGEMPRNAFWKAMAEPQSLTRRAFVTPEGLSSVGSMNTPAARQASLPAMGGIGTAQSLAKYYAMLANGGELDGKRFFSSEAIARTSRASSSGFDLVLREETAFSCGFMLDPLDSEGRKIRSLFGPSPHSFGHPGAGGSHAFADPENNLAFAYVMNQMETGVFPNQKSLRLVDCLYREA